MILNKATELLPLITLLLMSILLTGCAFNESKRQTTALNNLSKISGKVSSVDDAQVIYVQLYQKRGESWNLIFKQPVASGSRYQFPVLAGSYSVGAFVDSNRDGEYNPGELASYFGQEDTEPKVFELKQGQTLELAPLLISSTLQVLPKLDVGVNLRKSYQNIGRIISLKNSMFADKYRNMGMWRPIDFSEEIGGGLMFLDKYQADKIPVLFIHGMGGSSQEFSEIIKQLDKTKYQAWILYYPSGLKLDIISDYLQIALAKLHQEYQFKKLALVAHSMGGLMLRSFVMKHQQSSSAYQLAYVVTINSPLYGMASAGVGVNNSPLVVPAWFDLAPNSNYIKRIHNWRWPSSIPYHLIFSYLDGQDGDGVVAMNSQLSLSLQEEASEIYGFNEQHSKILTSQDFINKLMKIMKAY